MAPIADPNIGFILLVLGALGIYVEFTAPGLIFPGVAGGILVLLGLSSLSVLPINWAGAALPVSRGLAVCAGGEVCFARNFGNRRNGGHGAGRNAAD